MTKCIAPPRGNWIGQVYYLELDDKILRSVYWNGVNWVNSWGDPACSCDACSPPQISPPSAIEGSLMDMERRIKYDDKRGCWRVIFNGKVTTDELKTSGEAYQLMSEFISKKKEPKY